MKTKRKTGAVLTSLGLLLILAALALTGYNLWDAHRAETTANDAVSQLSELIPEREENNVASTLRTEMPTETVNGYQYVGVLDIPDLGLSLPVMNTWSYAQLKVAPCRYSGSVYTNDLVIAAHNYRFHFGHLKNLPMGSEVTFTDIEGNIFRYKVTSLETLQPDQTDTLVQGDWNLTMFTCTPGGATRVVVRCVRI